MKPRLTALSALLLLALLTTCARFQTVRVAGRNFDEEVALTQNLVFTFNRDLVSETQLGVWDSTQYVRFTPHLPGKFKWTGANELVFSPATSMRPATAYEAELTDQLLSRLDQRDLDIDEEAIAFHTPYLQLLGTERWWTRGADGRPVAKARLRFNYPVNSTELASRLTVEAGEEKALKAQVTTGPPAETVPVTLADAPASREEQPLTLRLDKGINVPQTAYTTQDALEATTALPPVNQLDVVDIQTGFAGNQGYVRVITTQELKPEALNAFTIEPAVETRTERTENGLIIRGNFTETDTYVLRLSQELQGVLGTRLPEEVTKDLFFGKMPASISFANKRAQYLSAKGSQNIGIQIVNVPEVTVRVAKLYENNLLPYLRSGRYEEYGEVNGQWQPMGVFNYNEDESGDYSDLLVNKTVATADLPKVRGVSALNLALPQTNDRFRGVYLVTVGSKEEMYMRASKLVSVSDLGLIAKQGTDEVWIFANSIRTAEPLADVDITLVSSSNQTITTVRTDDNGVARVEKLSEKAPGLKLALLTARTETDFNYLLLSDSRVETSRFEVDGRRDNASALDAFIYGERDIYRPGETIHLNTIVRQADWQSPGEIPLKLRVLGPNGREYRVFRQNTDAQGSVATDVPVDLAAVTGTYVVEVYSANEVLLSSRNVSVEEFIPDRIKVDVRTDRTAYRPGETLTLTATATNLFGPPAAGRTYEMERQLSRKAFAPKGYEAYSFAIHNNLTFEKELRQGVTNANGQATERFPLPATLRDIGLLEGKLYVTVFDENSRPVNRLSTFAVYTQDVFYGLRPAASYTGINVPLPVEVVALNRDGQPVRNASARVEVVRKDYQTVLEKLEGDNSLRYVSKTQERLVYANNLTLADGRGQFRYVPTVSGEYEIRIRRPGSEGYTAAPFYAYGYGSTETSSFEVSTEGQVLMEFDKPVYRVGDKARVLFKTPFAGKLLVTIERNQVLETQVLDTDNQSAEYSFKIEDEHLPNVYVTATLIRPLDDSNLPLTVAHGFAPVKVEDEDTRLPVEVTAAAESRSKTRQRITVKTEANAALTVAVVDEGILQMKNFQTPDIHGFFYQKRALEVSSHDLYGFLFPELALSRRSSSGGDGYNLGRRINPLSNGRVRLVTFWSGPLKANGSGEATFEVDIPSFSGNLRVMAVAYKGRAFGSAERNMRVADPIVISAGAPRFLSPGDSLLLPVTLTNTTKAPATVTATLRTQGALSGTGSQSITLAPGREGRVDFGLRAASTIGTGNLTISVRGLNETFSERIDLTVRPASPLQQTTQSGVIAAGQNQTIDFRHAFLPATVRSELVLSRSPLVQLGKPLSELLGYPYGCLEQVLSVAFPQLYFAELTKTIGKPGAYFVSQGESDLNPAFTVQKALRRVESQQLFNGGFALWPGTATEDPWVTAYALHFLTEASRAGFEVSPKVLSKAIDYLEAQTSGPATEERVSHDESGTIIRKVPSRTALYGLYVLALGGRPNRPAMNYYKSIVGQLPPDGRYLLAGAFSLAGDTRSYASLLPQRYADPTTGRQSGDSYASPIRNLALVLNTLLESEPDNIQIPELARQLGRAMNAATYLNTQEAVFATLALGKIARKAAASTATASVSASGKALGQLTGRELKLNRGLAGQRVAIQAKGTGSLYWFARTEGVSAAGQVPEADQGLRIRREFLDRDGNPLRTFRQNDLVVVRLTLASQDGIPVKNVVVTDLLPAGFESENPRLTEAREMPWVKNAAQPDHFDVRDDRIHFFTEAGGDTRGFYYLVRVVSRGTFTLGPVAADAMYDGSLRSYSGGGKVRVP